PRRYMNLGITAPESDLKAVLGLLSKSLTKDVASAKTSGKLKFDMKIEGILSDSLIPGVTINFDLSNGSVQYPKLPKPITALNLNGTVTEKRLDLKHFGAALGTNKVDGSLIVEDYNRKKINLTLFSQLNLAEVGQYYPLEQGTSVSGAVTSDIRVSAVLSDMKSAKASGKAEFKNVSARTAKMKTPVTNLNGQLLFNNERVELKNLSMLLGDSDIQLDGYAEQYLRVVFSDTTGKGKKPFFSAALRSKNLNLDKLLPEDSTKKAAPTAPKKREQLPNVDGQFSVDIASMTMNKITMKDVKGTVRLQNKVLDLSGLGMSVFSGRIGLAGDINLKDINRPLFNLDVDVKELSVPTMFAELPSLDKLAGVGKYMDGNVSLKSKLNGHLNDTLGLDLPSFMANGNFQMQQGKLAGMPMQQSIASALNADNLKSFNFKDWSNVFEVKNGRLFINNLKLNIDGTEVSASGSQGLDKSVDYKLKVNLPKSAQAGLQKAIGNFGANLLTDKSGKIPVELLVGGTFTSPKVSLDKQALISNAKASIVSELTGKVTGKKDSTAAAGVETAKKQVEEKVQKETKKLEDKAKNKLKKLFGK
ncbi:MAG: DUF3971 domain-containing protein, partial [Chlorobiales bacterium]|nr:DUF3971 domain-containing protein [Chlorobiales bacterium]